MGLSFMSIFSVFSCVGDWYKKAMDDGQVTRKELLQLGINLAGEIGLQVAPDIVEEAKSLASDVIEAVDDAVDEVKEIIDDVDTGTLKDLKQSK